MPKPKLGDRLRWSPPTRVGLPATYLAYKDPCVLHHAGRWHLFATAALSDKRFDVVQATSEAPGGPWRWHGPVKLHGATGSSVCAPGVASEHGVMHLFIQQAFNELGSSIMHLVSRDDGRNFRRQQDAIAALPGTDEAGLYDAHPVSIGGAPYIIYSAAAVVGQSDLRLARDTSGTWAGPWERLGALVRQSDLPWHNQPDDSDYEWGLEGGQLLQLPDERLLLNAVGFLSGQPRGQRQRVFVGLAERPLGPYDLLGPALPPEAFRETGENGHAVAVVQDGALFLIYQSRVGAGARWRLSTTSTPLASLLSAIQEHGLQAREAQ